MVEIYKDVHEFIRVKSKELLEKGNAVKSSNEYNAGTYKEELIELSHQFFRIKDSAATIFNLKNFKTSPWWFSAEILTEMLNLNPPLMIKYRPDIIEHSYTLTPQGTCEYLYATRWYEFNQFENIRQKLENNSSTKKAIIQTWMPWDLQSERKDAPCNVNYMFLGRDGKLDMTATIRSNDITKGTKYDYPLASFIQQSVSSWVGLEVGDLYFHINSLHVYGRDIQQLEDIVVDGNAKPIRLVIPRNIDSKTYWHNLRHIKKVEDASYHSAWDYCDKHLSDMTIPIFRDFARIFAIRNAKHYDNLAMMNRYTNELEDSEMQKWLK